MKTQTLIASAFVLVSLAIPNLGFVSHVTSLPINSVPEVRQESGWPKCVAGEQFSGDLTKRVSVAGTIFDGYVHADSSYGVYALDGRYSSFVGFLGMPDDADYDGGSFRFQIDGETVIEGKVKRGEKATPLELDLSNAQSFRIDLARAYIMAPKFVPAGITDSTKVSLVSPGNGAKAKRGNIMLTWKPIDKAVAYGIHLTPTKLDEAQPEGSQRIWAFTAGEQPVFSVNAKDMPTGEYRWTVIAFDDKRTLGVASDFRKLIITK